MFLPRLFTAHDKLPGSRSPPRARVVVEPDWPHCLSAMCESTGHTLVVQSPTIALRSASIASGKTDTIPSGGQCGVCNNMQGVFGPRGRNLRLSAGGR